MNSLLNKISLIMFVSLALPTFGISADTKKTTPAPDEKTTTPEKKTKAKSPYIPFKGEVVAATDKLLTLKGAAGKEDRKFVITADTKITKDDKPATVSDVKAGQHIGGSYAKGDDGVNTAHSINLSVKQKDAEKPKADAPKK